MVRDRTKTINQMHGFLLEFGVSLPTGKTGVVRLPELLSFHALLPRLVAILETYTSISSISSSKSPSSIANWFVSSPMTTSLKDW